TISALNSGVNERRRRGFFLPMLSMVGHPSGGEPLMVDVRQSGPSSHDERASPPDQYLQAALACMEADREHRRWRRAAGRAESHKQRTEAAGRAVPLDTDNVWPPRSTARARSMTTVLQHP